MNSDLSDRCLFTILKILITCNSKGGSGVDCRNLRRTPESTGGYNHASRNQYTDERYLPHHDYDS